MKTSIILKDIYIVRNTYKFKDGYFYIQDIATFAEKEKAITFIKDYFSKYKFANKEELIN